MGQYQNVRRRLLQETKAERQHFIDVFDCADTMDDWELKITWAAENVRKFCTDKGLDGYKRDIADTLKNFSHGFRSKGKAYTTRVYVLTALRVVNTWVSHELRKRGELGEEWTSSMEFTLSSLKATIQLASEGDETRVAMLAASWGWASMWRQKAEEEAPTGAGLGAQSRAEVSKTLRQQRAEVAAKRTRSVISVPWHTTLRVNENEQDWAVIKKSFRDLCKKQHPDKLDGDTTAFVELSNAYAIAKDIFAQEGRIVG